MPNFIERILDVIDIAEGSPVCVSVNADKYQCDATCSRGRPVTHLNSGMRFYLVFEHGKFVLIENSD